MNAYLIIILVALIGRYVLDLVADVLNLHHFSAELPTEFDGLYDADKYTTSQQYLQTNTRFGLFASTCGIAVTLLAILLGGFNMADNLARSQGLAAIPTGLLFAAIVAAVSHVLGLPFALYRTFVIEARFGFNRTTAKTFILDQIKGLALGVIIGAPVFAGIMWFFSAAGRCAWLYCWLGVTVLQVVLIFVAPYVIMPLFNKFDPLEEGDLRTAIEAYAARQKFRMKGVFRMDGSKRSSKTNAFFTGFGGSRRIVLFDTLIQRHTVEELLGVVAHEMGHYKLHHIPLAILRAIISSGVMFFVLSVFMENNGLFAAFRMEQTSIYASLILFGFLYAPISLVLAIAGNAISRRHEYDADRFAAETTGNPEALVASLKKLSVDNLSNLTPHPFMVWLHYGHPPVLDRVAALRRKTQRPETGSQIVESAV